MSELYDKGRFDAQYKPRLTSMDLNMTEDEYLSGYIEALCENAMILPALHGVEYLKDLKEQYMSVPRAINIIQSHLHRLNKEL